MIKIEKFPFAPKGDGRAKKGGYLHEAKKMSKYIKDGDVIYDCGANIFDHSTFFAINNPHSTIVAFEPVKEYFEMGLKNAEYFNVSNIIAMNVALGDKKGKMNISIDNEGSSLVFDHQNAEKQSIMINTIDFLVESQAIPAPNLIKIDVEGFALPLIKGAERTIKKYKPTVIIEIHPMFVGDKEAKQKIYLLQEFGLNIVDQLAKGREFVMSKSKKRIDLESAFNLPRILELREEYDFSKSKHDRKNIIHKYKAIKKSQKIPFGMRMIGSQIYVTVTFKGAK